MLFIEYWRRGGRAAGVICEGQRPVGQDGDRVVRDAKFLQGSEHMLQWSRTVREGKGAQLFRWVSDPRCWVGM